MTCRICGHRLRYVARDFKWLHVSPGADHAPIPVKA